MAAVSIQQALAIEALAISSGWTSEQLLNAAGERLGHAIGRFFPISGTVVGYLGKGHNAGDALVALRVLRDCYDWKIAARLAYPIQQCAPLTASKWDELGLLRPLDRQPDWRDSKRPLLLLDGLVGSGGSGPLREPLASLAREMATLRQLGGARVAAVDLPSGINPDSGEIFSNTVIADVTFMIGNAKAGLLSGHAANATGSLAVVAVEPLAAIESGESELISPQTCNVGKSPRPFDFHKGMAGRVAVVAGSESYLGAAVFAASGALRGGAGLVTLFVPTAIHRLIAGKCPAEIIVRAYENPSQVLESRFDSLVVGCGLGEIDTDTGDGLLDLISNSPAPVVVDADALNLIAQSGNLKIFSSKHVLTPHPGEFARLAPDLADLPREVAARRFADRTPATLLLKGCRTIIARKSDPLWFNSTGTPGMATGGHGDLLAGVIGARLAVGESTLDAATLGAWLCGRASEIALQESKLSEEALLPSDILHFLGAAFRDWKTSTR